MRKPLITLVLFGFAIYYGFNYILSEDFQVYGDRKKAQWTCRVNIAVGGLYKISSSYKKAHDLFDRVLKRCPNTEMAGEAMFNKASCLEEISGPTEAMAVYQEYIDTFPQGDKYYNAMRAINRIKVSK